MLQSPGVLDFKLQLTPISRISPSRYQTLKLCALREVWAAGRQSNLLPVHPTARVGTITHRLFEDASSGRFSTDKRAIIEERWNELLTEIEQAMFDSWLERHFVPLKATVRDFEVRKIRAISRALEMVQISTIPARDDRPVIAQEEGLEFWLETHDGLIGGYIDYVAQSQEGAVIRDYKSGDILEENSGKLKTSYEIQLQLYAALYQATTGKWPARLEIVPLQGSPMFVPFDPQNCTDLLSEATATLKQVNSMLVSFVAVPNEAERQLANPSPSNCRQCTFRPGCVAYQQSRLANRDAGGWPNDVIGTLEEIRKLGNGKLMIIVKTDGGESTLAYIRGVNSKPRRHPALEYLQNQDRIGLFNLSTNNATNTFTESQLAVIYKML